MNKFWLGLIFIVLSFSSAQAAGAPRVSAFSPTGYVKSVRQVAVRFSAPMTSFGDPRQDAPFTIDCAAKGSGRWADSRNWIYDFDEDLEGGVQCHFTLKQGLKTLSGQTVGGQKDFTFNTGGPAIEAMVPYQGSYHIDENQLFLISLNAHADEQSIKDNAYCTVEGLAERLPVKLITGAKRASLLKESRTLGYQFRRLLTQNGKTSDTSKIVALQCPRTLPPATRIQLVWGAGIKSASGLATTKPQIIKFKTRPAFEAHFTCERVNAEAPCLPMMDMRLTFSAPIATKTAKTITLTAADGSLYTAKPRGDEGAPITNAVDFKGPFPEDSAFTLSLPASIVDDSGRTLDNQDRFPLTVKTDAFPPLVKFPAPFGILESKIGGVLPVTVRNVAAPLVGHNKTLETRALRAKDAFAAIEWIERVKKAGQWRGDYVKNGFQTRTGDRSILKTGKNIETFQLPRPNGDKAFEVIGIPLKKPGFYVVEVQSPRLGKALLGREATRYVATSALVTNMAVHFKWGREESLVWVTSLDRGKPVGGAAVSIGDTCTKKIIWEGKTQSDGTVHIRHGLHAPQSWGGCYSEEDHPYVVSAAKNDDFSFTLSSWNDGIAPYDFDIDTGSAWQTDFARTVFDRTLLRAGETVSMKHVVRRHVGDGLVLPRPFAKKGTKKGKIRIVHDYTGQEVFQDVDFDASGTGTSAWSIPKEARLGFYSVSVKIGDDWKDSGSFRVEEFRLPTMEALIQGPTTPVIMPASVTLDLMVRYLSGGGASGQKVKLRTLTRPAAPRFKAYKDYAFDDAPIAAQTRSSGQGEDEGEHLVTGLTPVTLDDSGAQRVTLDKFKDIKRHAQLVTELEYADANGQSLTKSASFSLWPAALAVGIKTEGWAATTDKLKAHVVVLDTHGKPAPGKAVTVKAFSRKTYSYRKRLIGGFYSYENTTKTVPIKASCTGNTDQHGQISCQMAPRVSGEVILQARVSDDQGHEAHAKTSIWVVDKDDWWFAGTDGDRMDLLVENIEYNGGDTAKVQVRSPFRNATALVTIEREGVLDSFITKIKGKEPIINVPIKGSYAPNVFVSVLAIRGRTNNAQNLIADLVRKYDLPWLSRDGGKATALIDLAKPAYRLGIAKLRVGWKAHRLAVSVKPEKDTYRIRQKVKAHIHVARADGGALPVDSEIALAVVDEALLQLSPNKSWNLLAGMMDERGLEVLTSTAQMQIIGKRHYGRKAVPHGGGGGRQNTRQLFDTLLLWRGRVKLDDKGNAQIEFALNDSLSAFRVVAIAQGGLNFFGTGSAKITTTQDLQLLSGLPPVVRENDRFLASFTARNTTNRPITALIGGEASGLGPLKEQTVTIAPGKAQIVTWDVIVPYDRSAIDWRIGIQEKDGTVSDALKVHQSVKPAIPLRVFQSTLRQLTQPWDIALQRPKDAMPGRGGVDVSLQAHIGDGLEGVRRYMQAYPYSCFEQRTSVAIALQDETRWKNAMRVLPAFMDKDGLIKYFPSDYLRGSDTLTAYVLAIADQAGWEIPEAQRGQLLNALRRFAQGRLRRGSALNTPDLTLRKIAAIEALSRYDAADAKLLTSIDINPNEWPTSAVIDYLNILKRVDGIKNRSAKMARVTQIIRSRLNFQGTHMGFSTEKADNLWWLMTSGDTNAARALISLAARANWRDDMPRMARGLLGRQNGGRWRTTTGNAWGVLAMKTFSQAYEKEKVSGISTTSARGKIQSRRWGKDNKIVFKQIPWSKGRQSLTIAHQGRGAPWAFISARAAIPLRDALSSGYKITRTITPIEQAKKGVWSPGDSLRIKLDIDAQSDMTWVVIDDPIPTGASILGTGLGGDSALLASGARETGNAWPVYQERKFDAYRAYYRYVPKGKFSLEYTIRLNTEGQFNLPPTRVEAMYAPEMFGEVPIAPLTVGDITP